MFIEKSVSKDGEYIEDSAVNIVSISGINVNSAPKVDNSMLFSNGYMIKLTF